MNCRYTAVKKIIQGMLTIMAVLAGISFSVSAGELGHYMPGVRNVRDFIVPDPGFYYLQYNIYYTSNTYKDRNGKEVSSIGPIKFESQVDSYAVAPVFLWSSSQKILGASYAAFAQPAIVNTSYTLAALGGGIDESQWGFGDLYLKPIWLGWNNIHTSVAIGYGIYAPTGEYSDGAVDNTGLGFLTHEFQASLTVFPWEHKGTAVMVSGTYEIHHDKDGADITPGDRFSLDYGISQYIPVNKEETLIAELGLSGYSQWQVDNDSGRDVHPLLNVKDEVHALGGQLGLSYVPWNASVSFRYLKEYDAEARYEGELFSLSFAKGF
ncbi:MAG: transporter [Desulfobacter sp.]|nr:transporter [Desulfobacter sp.]WDP84985.1 MAG: transporter [Desulfobacter sp.]